MKFKKQSPLITIRTTAEKRNKATIFATSQGMTLSGMIRYAVKKIFGIEI